MEYYLEAKPESGFAWKPYKAKSGENRKGNKLIDVTFKIGGRTVNPNRFGDEIAKAILAEFADKVKKALGSVTCPEHAQRPKVTVKGRDINHLSWEVEGCCQKLVDTAMEKLK